MKTDKYRRLQSRRNDQDFLYNSYSMEDANRILNKSYQRIQFPETVKYIIESMQEMDSAYTLNSYKEGERVKSHLEDLTFDVSFEYQGSVTNNTHIKAHSDIDLLVIIEKFFSLEHPLKPQNPYSGNPIDDLYELRGECNQIFESVYTSVDIDNSGSCAISLSGGSLRRKVDVVPSNWYETVKYRETNLSYYKGIQVLDKTTMIRNINYPFLNNQLIEQKDIDCNYNYRKAIRLLKNIKADADNEINISSYDIIAILFHMTDDKYLVSYYPLNILINIEKHFNYLITYPNYFNQLNVPDNSRKISEKTSITDLRDMKNEITNLKNQATMELYNVGKSLNSVQIVS